MTISADLIAEVERLGWIVRQRPDGEVVAYFPKGNVIYYGGSIGMLENAHSWVRLYAGLPEDHGTTLEAIERRRSTWLKGHPEATP